jgi:hypothetical protein
VWQSLLCLAAMLGATACSQDLHNVGDTTSIAIFGEDDTLLSVDAIEALPYASIYAQIEDGPQAFLVLAFAEDNLNSVTELKWLSADRAMLVTANGRLVKTYNIPAGNLLNSSSTQPDPLSLGLHLPSTPTSWQHTLDWQPGYHMGYTLNSSFKKAQPTSITINNKSIVVQHFVETVLVESLSLTYRNDFWIDPATGVVLRSRQKIAPSLPYIVITLLKPYGKFAPVPA